MKSISIIGRGSIGLLTALELHKQYPEIEITLYGEKSKYSASYAAGAMINILSEIDCFNVDLPITKWKLKNRSSAIKAWDKLNDYLIDKKIVDKSIFTSFGTRMSLIESSINECEKNSFDSVIRAAKEFEIDIDLENKGNEQSILIRDEHSVDSNHLLGSIDDYLNKQITVIDHNVDSIEKNQSDNSWVVQDSKGNIRKYDAVVIACGSWSEKLIAKSKGISLPKVQSFYGIGCALLVKSQMSHLENPKLTEIKRTPNRGGTCGIHGVQRNNSVYVGASSHVSHKDLRSPNPESIRVLIEGTQKFLDINTAAFALGYEIAMGYRPVTSDHVPIIGSLSDNLFCLYGTKRDGLTWAPYYSEFLVKNIFGESANNWDELLDLCSPYRNHISAGDIDECIDLYLLTKEWEDYQHNQIFDDNKKKRLRMMAERAHEFINKDSEKNIGLNPEIINVMYYRNCV